MYNVNGYFDTMEKSMAEMAQKNFLAQACRSMYKYFTDEDELLDYIQSYSPESTPWRVLKRVD